MRIVRSYIICCAALAIAGGATAQARDPQGYGAQAPASQASDDPPPALAVPAQPPVNAARLPPVGMAPVPPAAPDAQPAQVAQADPGPRVAVARRIVDAAGAFDGYMHRTARINVTFTSGDSVARAVELGSVFEPKQLEEGAIAYAALTALQDPAFVEAVREVGQDPSARDTLVGRLVDHPEAVLETAAARRAATRVSLVLGKIGMDMLAAGAAVRQASYDLQSQPWSKQAIATPDQRLARIEAESATPVSLAPSDTQQLISGLVAQRSQADGSGEASSVTPVVARGLALAALAILGMAGDDQEQQIAPLLTDARDAQCIRMARLNDLQCLSVAGPQYEDLFCLGNHAMMDSGRCIASAAGVSDSELRRVTDQRSVFVPIALASNEGTGPSPASRPQQPSGVAVPTAAVAAPVSYSPYRGPVQP